VIRASAAASGRNRNLALDVLAAVGVGVALAVVTGLLPGIARQSGMAPMGLAALAAAPFLANVFGLLAGRVGPRSARGAAVTRAAGCVALVVAPLLPTLGVIGAVLLFWVGYAFGQPLQLRLWGIIYPARQRGRLVAIVRTAQTAATAVVAIVGGVLADRVGGHAVLAVAGVVAGALVLAYGFVRAPSQEPQRAYTARDCLRSILAAPRIRLLLLAQVVLGAGMSAAVPLYALVQVDRLHLSLAEIGMLGVVTALATTFSYMPWGVLADRRLGTLGVLSVGGLLGVAGPLGYALAPDLSVLWLASVGAGLSNAAIDIGITGALSDKIPLSERAPLMAAWNGITGMRGAVAPLLLGALVQGNVVGPAAALLGCSAVSCLGVVIYGYVAWRRVPVAAPLAGRAPRLVEVKVATARRRIA